MSWVWVLPAVVTVSAVVVLAVGLRRVVGEAKELRAALGAWDRMAVAIGDLDHDARRAELGLRRLTRR